jgi:hypothetical protein
MSLLRFKDAPPDVSSTPFSEFIRTAGATGSSTLTGAMSADGNVFVLADVTSGEAATLLVGLRQ